MPALDILTANDRPGAHAPSWYAATANPAPDDPPLTGHARADICVIGGGYTGLSAALHLAERGFDVVLLDAHRPGWGASGRNGGQVGTGMRLSQPELEPLVGPEDARHLWELAEEAKALIRDRVARHGIDCDFLPGALYTDHKARFADASRREVDLLRTRYGYDAVSFVGREELRAMLGTDAYHCGTLDRGAGHLHPLNFALGLAAAAREAGARLHGLSRVTGIEPGDPATIRTAEGSVTARHVILACNGYLGGLEPRVASKVMPINNYIIATEPLGEARARALIRDNVAVADSKFVVNYYRLSRDWRLLFGGTESYSYRFPTDIAAAVRRPMEAIYPQMKGIGIDYAWGGTLAITMNRLPHFARLGPNMLSLSGYSGHGVALATLAGQLAAEAVAGQAERFDTFARLPAQPFPGGTPFRSALLKLAMTWYSLRDRL